MAVINVDFNRVTGRIKPMHAVGQPPFTGGFCKLDFSHIRWLKEANIPYSRLHDVGGAFGSNRYVDIPNIFRDFEADEYQAASYDFAFTDVLLEGMAKYGIKPIFRLGVTIENQCHIKAYRIHPPKDYGKWARICEHIIRHYNEGWANGYHYDIRYWEIWNEPENRDRPEQNQMWTGTAKQYYELYDVTAKHLKACFGDSIKIGGYGASGFYHIFAEPEKYGMHLEKRTQERYITSKEVYRMEFLYGFFDYIAEHNSPIDFFSWHSYLSVEENVIMAEFLDKFLAKRGYAGLETMLNEWNNAARNQDMAGTSFAAVEGAAMLLAMQNTATSMLCYYDARMTYSSYAGMFNVRNHEPYCLYYSFKAFGFLYMLGDQVYCDNDTERLFAVAAYDGDRKAVMIVNATGRDIERVETNLEDGFALYLIDEEHKLEKVDWNVNAFGLKKNQTVLLKNDTDEMEL